jgi:hypothetical protein
MDQLGDVRWLIRRFWSYFAERPTSELHRLAARVVVPAEKVIPGKSGLDILKELRGQDCPAPVRVPIAVPVAVVAQALVAARVGPVC